MRRESCRLRPRPGVDATSLSLLLAGEAHALSITGTPTCTQQVNNPLRFDCAITTDADAEVFEHQHHAHWGPTGELLLFDNKFNTTGSRGMVYDVDTTSFQVSAIEEYSMEDSTSTYLECGVGGSMVGLLGGNALVTCPREDTTPADPYAAFNEFDASNNVIRVVTLDCLDSDFVPTSTAFRGYANPW